MTVVWDGIDNCYIPGETLEIDPRLQLHVGEAVDLDPFLFEILRHNLWNVNDEHGTAILKVSGSPIAQFGQDFQTAILTEDAEYIFFGPRVQTQSGTMDFAIKWILEHRSAEPGIRDGDMFLCNDPWVGATHQQDAALYCPVFWDGRLFCWVSNLLHQYDVGGSTPGGFCPDARDTFVEPPSIPPVRIVEGGALRPDIEEMYLRRSRMPKLLALDLRAQIAGNLAASQGVLSLIRRYGPDVVKASMRKIIDDAERVFAARLAKVPDGTWRARSYLEVALDGDRGVYNVELQMAKRGSELEFAMDGTHEQVGALNISFSTWRSGILTAVTPMLCHDLLYAAGGPLRRMRFRPTPGTMLCATFPGSTSNAQIGAHVSGAMASKALGAMLSCDRELEREVFAPGAASVYPVTSLSGVNQDAEPYGTILLDPAMGGTGAFTFKDGIDTGGIWISPCAIGPNIEENESHYPMLYLYRREWADAGGAGRWRGGNSGVLAYIAHGTQVIDTSISAAGVVTPTGEGLLGGLPGAPNHWRFLAGSDVHERFGRQEMPTDIGDLEGRWVDVGPKERNIRQTASDVMETAWCAGGGIGDPAERDPELVARDVRARAVTREWARTVYGVAIATDGSVDGAQTEALRADLRRRRLQGRPLGTLEGHPLGDGELEVGDALVVVDDGHGGRIACQSCRTVLARGVDGNYKDGCVCIETHVADAAIPHIGDPARWVDATLVLREFACPGCARLLATEVAPDDAPYLHDIELAPRRPAQCVPDAPSRATS